jgi:fatty acid synthase
VFYPNKSYIIIGGLGGFGLELVNCMIERGAMTLILTSRRSPTEPYQYYRLKYFKDNGIRVIVSKTDASTQKGAKKSNKISTKIRTNWRNI